jgi:hypothetical protein
VITVRKIIDWVFGLLLGGILVGIIWPAIAADFLLPKPSPSEPIIYGTPEFKEDIQNAIKLLKENSPENYNKLCLHIRRIKLSDCEGLGVVSDWKGIIYSKSSYKKDRQIENTANNNPAYVKTYPIARTLVHETTHLIQLDREGGRMVFFNAKEREREALLAERDFLKEMKVPQKTIERISGDYLLQKKWWKNPNLYNPILRIKALLD